MKLSKEQIEENTQILCITQAGQTIWISNLIADKPEDHQEGRAIEVMFTFENMDPYFVYYFNEDYYSQVATRGLGGIADSFDAEENRNNISQCLAGVLLSLLYSNNIDLRTTSGNFSHNYANTNTIMYVESLKRWYPIRHTMNEGEYAAETKVKAVNSGRAKITDYISIYDLSPRDA